MQGSRTQKSERSQPKVTKNFGKKRKKLALQRRKKIWKNVAKKTHGV
jgi:hypothetical protein